MRNLDDIFAILTDKEKMDTVLALSVPPNPNNIDIIISKRMQGLKFNTNIAKFYYSSTIILLKHLALSRNVMTKAD